MRRRLAARLAASDVQFSRLPVASVLALVLVSLVALVAVVAPLIAPYDPLAPGTPAVGPSGEHWFGTDRNGRDVFSRLVHGARSSLVVGLGATVLALVGGAVLGSIAATSRRLVNESIMRVLDVVMAFPGIILAAVFVTVFGATVPVLVGTIAILYVPSLARIVRANVLSQFGEDYVAAERVMGAGRAHILWRHVARNCAAPVMVFATVLVADAIVLEASLSFIGAGVQPPAPSWGNVISDGRSLVLSGGWWATFFPGMAILITALSLNVLAEGLTDAWANPKARTPKASRAPATSAGVASSAAPGENATGLSTSSSADDLVVPQGAQPTQVEDEIAVAQGTERAPDPLPAYLQRLSAAERARADRLPAVSDVPPLLEVHDLRIAFPDRHGDVSVVDGVDLAVRPGETLGLVGESGCGKSLTSLAVMGLLPRNAQVGGQIRFDGQDLLASSKHSWNRLRGHEMAMVYQDALSSLNPSMLVGSQLRQLSRRGGDRTPTELLELVHLNPARTLKSYPHELSGGQRQRVLIAMALSRSPRLIVADEPTTALDVTVQAQVVELLGELRDELGFAMVLVSHDLGLVAELAHRVAVMYAGQISETGTTTELLTAPRHHYTRGLLGSVLSIEGAARRLHQVPGTVPAPAAFGRGCRFADRCPAATDVCRVERPELEGAAGAGPDARRHEHACHHPVLQVAPSATSVGGAR